MPNPLVLSLMLVFSLTIQPAIAKDQAHAKDLSLERIEFQSVPYLVYRCDPDKIELHWKGPSGTAYRRFSNLRSELVSQNRRPIFLMNAGIFEPGGIPSGLHVENGKELRPINLRDAPGNFFLKPNGVFLIGLNKVGAAQAAVLESHDYAKQKPPHFGLETSTQSFGKPQPAVFIEMASVFARRMAKW